MYWFLLWRNHSKIRYKVRQCTQHFNFLNVFCGFFFFGGVSDVGMVTPVATREKSLNSLPPGLIVSRVCTLVTNWVVCFVQKKKVPPKRTTSNSSSMSTTATIPESYFHSGKLLTKVEEGPQRKWNIVLNKYGFPIKQSGYSQSGDIPNLARPQVKEIIQNLSKSINISTSGHFVRK